MVSTVSFNSPWLPNHKPRPQSQLRLFCFPYAGGSALTYRKWQDSLPPDIEVCPVQLTGRGSRLRETPFRDHTALVLALAQGLTPYLDKPCAFFGHSMGAIISFELARYLQQENGFEISHLFVSGRRAPQFPRTDPYTFNLPEAEFVEELRRLNGTPSEVLFHPELMNLMLPLLRADFELIETYSYVPGPPLTCPITAFGGLDDEEVKDVLDPWREQTGGPFSLHMFPGDHFFVNTAHRQLTEVIAKKLYGMKLLRI
ncbi:MAG TPA: thioesterase II family protein [Pyrinomonadaceae bacterium]|nr:thioesterase II family protein [Pyrinomonadaceae bacterium]